jgi:hypothetical protein
VRTRPGWKALASTFNKLQNKKFGKEKESADDSFSTFM